MRIVRVMPNTPALVGAGAASLTPNSACTDVDKQIAELIFNSIGITYECKESLVDAVTGLSGSGPAYGFMFIEAMVDGAV